MTRHDFWRAAGASLSLANLLTVGRWDASQDQWYTYFRKLPDSWFLVRANLLTVALWAAVVLAVWLVAVRSKPAPVRKAGLLILLGFLFLAGDVVLARSGRAAEMTSHFAVPLACAWSAIAVAAVLWQEERAWKWMTAVLLFALPLLPIAAANTGWRVLRAGVNAAPPDKPLVPLSGAASPAGHRLLWIIFDELDYDIAFSHRPAGLQMPEFDRLRRQALFAENAFQPGHGTEVSIPAFLIGHTVRRAERQGSNELMLGLEGASTPVPWSRQSTIFTKAHDQGFNSSVTGFFHPYCRVLSDLAACYWQPFTFTLAETGEYNQPFFKHLRVLAEQPWLDSPVARKLGVVDATRSQREKMRYLYQSVLAHAEQEALNPAYALVYVHMPVPHPPGYWNPQRGDFAVNEDATYVDNLALVDRTLGEFRRTLEQAGLWNRTSLLVTSDHPLRPGSDDGPRTDFKASGQARSKLVPFVLHMAGQSGPVTYPDLFHTVIAGDMVLAILKGELRDEKAVGAWIAAHETAH